MNEMTDKEVNKKRLLANGPLDFKRHQYKALLHAMFISYGTGEFPDDDD